MLGKSRERWLAYLFLLPAAVVLLVFSIYPLLFAVNMSVHKYHGRTSEYVGLANYRYLLAGVPDRTDPAGGRVGGDFWRALGVTVWYTAGVVPVALVLSFLLANLLFQKLRARGMFRTIYFLPYVTSTVAAAVIWRWMFAPGSRGLANTVLGWIGLDAQRWYYESTGLFQLVVEPLGLHLPEWAGGPSLALVCVMIFSVWHALGFDVVILLAGLSAIPKEMYEAAEVDGATGLRRMRHITLPLLSPTLFFLTIISVIRSFQAFNQIYILTREESIGSTENLTMLVFNNFYGMFDQGMATAAAVLLFAIILGLTLFQMRVLGPRVHY